MVFSPTVNFMNMPQLYVLYVILGFLALGQAQQIPKAYTPGDSVTYPANYCENIKNYEKFDFIVIGSGPGGSTVARRLAENPTTTVLLIEAGGNPPKHSDLPLERFKIQTDPLGTYYRWDYQTKPDTFGCASNINKTCKYGYGKVLGGSSAFNCLFAVRGNPKDFDEWEQLGNKGWAYKDVLPYFKKMETYNGPPPPPSSGNLTIVQKIQRFQNSLAGDETKNFNNQYHGTDGPLSISNFPIDPHSYEIRQTLFEAFKALKLPINEDANGKTQIGFGNLPGTIDTLGYRDGIIKAYLQNLPKNLKVCKNAMVWKLNVNDSTSRNKKVASVLFEFNNQFYNVTAKKEYILSAGGFGSPQVMERSGIGNPKILKNAGVMVRHVLPGVGENLQDHFSNNPPPCIVNLKNEASPNPLTIGITSLTGFLNLTDYLDLVPDVEIILAMPEVPISPHLKSGKTVEINEGKNTRSLFFLPFVLRQQICGSAHITQATDPNLSPLIEPNFYKGERDMKLAIAGTRLVRKFMRHPALEKFEPKFNVIDQCKQFKEDSDEEITCQVSYSTLAGYHAVGTSAMGPNPQKHVVNDELKVHGIRNLRIIDSSIMPLIVRANIELSTIMIAEKGADMVKARWNGW